MDTESEILRYPLRILKWCGRDPEQSNMKHFVFATVFIFLASTEISITILQIFCANGDVNAVAQNLDGTMAASQIVRKCQISAIKVEGFRKIIDDTRKFWSIKMCTKDVQIELENNLKRTLQLEKLFFFMMTCTAITVVAASFLLKQLPVGFWTMKDHNLLFTVTLVIQQTTLAWASIYTAAYDGLFLSLCVSLRTQFKMLHCCLRDLDPSSVSSKSDEKIYLDKLISYVRHHEFLLRFSKDMRNIYSFVMLLVYSTVLLMYCAEMYMLFESKDIFLIIRNLVVMPSGLILFAFYCIPLNYVTDEAISVSQGVFSSKWYSKHLPASKSFMTPIIQRSQQDTIFKAGGLIEMNYGAMLGVIRMSYSVCTIMRALKNV